MNNQLKSRFHSLGQIVGQTPMYRIRYRYRGGPEQDILVKYELGNPTGSIKDRMALHILQRAYEQGQIRPGDTIVEATSGSTGIAFAALGRALGHPVRIIMPDWLSTERKQLIGAMVPIFSWFPGNRAAFWEVYNWRTRPNFMMVFSCRASLTIVITVKRTN